MRKKLFPWRTLVVILTAFFAVLGIGAFAPGPVEGIWHTKMLACMCNSRNLVEFTDGIAVMSSGHPEPRGQRGTYFKKEGVWTWEYTITEKGFHNVIEVRPTWFFVRFYSPVDGTEYWGHRVLWPPSIREARAQQQPVPEGEADL